MYHTEFGTYEYSGYKHLGEVLCGQGFSAPLGKHQGAWLLDSTARTCLVCTLSLFYRLGNQGKIKSNNLSKVIAIIWTGIWTGISIYTVQLQSLLLLTTIHTAFQQYRQTLVCYTMHWNLATLDSAPFIIASLSRNSSELLSTVVFSNLSCSVQTICQFFLPNLHSLLYQRQVSTTQPFYIF